MYNKIDLKKLRVGLRELMKHKLNYLEIVVKDYQDDTLFSNARDDVGSLLDASREFLGEKETKEYSGKFVSLCNQYSNWSSKYSLERESNDKSLNEQLGRK